MYNYPLYCLLPPPPVVKNPLSFIRLPESKKVASALLLVLALSIGFSGLMGLSSEATLANHSQCSDGLDNDHDGKTDYPQDDDCENLDDDFEGLGISGNFITLTDGKESVQPGGAVVYVITLKQQRTDARVVNLDLHLPYQSNIVSASDGGSVSPSHVRWTNVSVYKNVTRTLQVHANVSPDVPAGQYLVARALVEGAEATDTTLVENYVAPQGDQYDISISDGREYALPGNTLDYTVRVKNISTQTRTNDVRVALPYDVTFQSMSDGGTNDSYNVSWKNVTFAPGEQKTYKVSALLDYRTRDKYVIRARAYAGTVSALDQTVVRIGLPYDAITTSLSDNRTTAELGQVLNYVLKVTNNSDVVGTNVAVDAGFPVYGQFQSASDGGISDGNNVRWIIVQMAPHEVRTLRFSVRVRGDAPMGTILMASAVADGANGTITRDSTKVVEQSNENDLAEPSVIFRKSADRSEAVPGGSIRYTLYIKNTLDHVISDASIVDRFDSRYLSFVSSDHPQNIKQQSEGNLIWTVPVLKPGETWTATYVLAVSADAPSALELDNVASLRGSDVSGLSLTERVRTNKSGVIRDFPTTGAGMDAILALVLAAAAVVTSGAQRKLAFGKMFLGL